MGQEVQIYYDWDDEVYRNFMLDIFQNMEPFFEHKHKYIHRELADVGEVFFLQKGLIDIGFELNKKDRPVLRVKKGAIIGGYNCTFNTKTMYVYKCASRVEGYIIRKHAW